MKDKITEMKTAFGAFFRPQRKVARVFITPRGLYTGAAGLMEIIDMTGTRPMTAWVARALEETT